MQSPMTAKKANSCD